MNQSVRPTEPVGEWHGAGSDVKGGKDPEKPQTTGIEKLSKELSVARNY